MGTMHARVMSTAMVCFFRYNKKGDFSQSPSLSWSFLIFLVIIHFCIWLCAVKISTFSKALYFQRFLKLCLLCWLYFFLSPTWTWILSDGYLPLINHWLPIFYSNARKCLLHIIVEGTKLSTFFFFIDGYQTVSLNGYVQWI